MTDVRIEPSADRTPAEGGWKPADAAELYQVDQWSDGYFAVNTSGHVSVRPHATTRPEIDLLEVVEGLAERGLDSPVLLRFSDILVHRLRRLHDAFGAAIRENDYHGRYIAVYPIKVNQQRPVVEEVHRHGQELDFGLEVGSKPELLAVMAMTAGDRTPRLIVCNGFKDSAYIEATVLASKLGRFIIPVVENLAEMRLLLEQADAYGVRPRVGVRLKLASRGAGRWGASAGDRSKFGLHASELLEAFRLLRDRSMEDCLQLVHCHAGSQLQDIGAIKDAVGELAHVYAELGRMGANGLRYIDVGGGLGVDYDGSRTDQPSSMNYTIEEYASEVVYRIASVCEDKGIEHPTIVSESGRAMAAYQSVLVFNVVGTVRVDRPSEEALPGSVEEVMDAGDGELAPPVRDLVEAYEGAKSGSFLESFHDALQARGQVIELFNLGYLSLEERGLAEQLFWATCALINQWCRELEDDEIAAELEVLEELLSDTFFCNFSIFQSLPDSWAIGQVFPIMPIHRLNEPPTRRGILADLTCDSDGRVDRFADVNGERRTLDLHEPRKDEPYYLAAFLVGAYQETLGDLHNLFGDTHVVHLRLHEAGGWWIEEVVRGDTAREVLSYVQYDVGRMLPALRGDCEQAVRDRQLTVAESRALLNFYETELDSYTYLLP